MDTETQKEDHGKTGRGYKDAVISQGSLGLPGTEEAREGPPLGF